MALGTVPYARTITYNRIWLSAHSLVCDGIKCYIDTTCGNMDTLPWQIFLNSFLLRCDSSYAPKIQTCIFREYVFTSYYKIRYMLLFAVNQNVNHTYMVSTSTEHCLHILSL